MLVNTAPATIEQQFFISEDEEEYYEERAAVLEYAAGWSREDAEQQAYLMVIANRDEVRIAG